MTLNNSELLMFNAKTQKDNGYLEFFHDEKRSRDVLKVKETYYKITFFVTDKTNGLIEKVSTTLFLNNQYKKFNNKETELSNLLKVLQVEDNVIKAFDTICEKQAKATQENRPFSIENECFEEESLILDTIYDKLTDADTLSKIGGNFKYSNNFLNIDFLSLVRTDIVLKGRAKYR